jgi:peptide/nickel transport system permease protein
LAGLVLAAIFANVLPLDNYKIPVGPPRQAPGFSSVALLGTDSIGRSELSRLVFGARQSLIIGASTVLVGLALGGLLGLLAAYFRGRLDAAVALFTDSVLAIPPLLLIVAVTAFLHPSLLTLIIALSFLSVPTFIRVSRANTLTLAQREFVDAARALGASRRRIIFKELLPNVTLPLMSYVFLITGVVIVAEGTLSFLGLGVPPPQPSWGAMIHDGSAYLSTSPYLVFVPAAVLAFTVLALNIVGDHARARFEQGQNAE